MSRKKRPIVAVGRDGSALSFYESTAEAARMNGLYASCICLALRKGTTHRNIRWVYEEQYREYWMQGQTEKLSYSVKKNRSDAAFKGWEKRTSAQRKKMRENCRKSRLKYLESHAPKTEAAVQRRRRPVLCISTGKVYESASAFARYLGVDHSAVTYAIRNGRRVKNQVVKYITKEEYEEYNKRRIQTTD